MDDWQTKNKSHQSVIVRTISIVCSIVLLYSNVYPFALAELAEDYSVHGQSKLSPPSLLKLAEKYNDKNKALFVKTTLLDQFLRDPATRQSIFHNRKFPSTRVAKSLEGFFEITQNQSPMIEGNRYAFDVKFQGMDAVLYFFKDTTKIHVDTTAGIKEDNIQTVRERGYWFKMKNTREVKEMTLLGNSTTLRNIRKDIKRVYAQKEVKDYRQLNRSVLALKQTYGDILDLFLIKDKDWYLQVQIDGQMYYLKITFDGSYESIKQEVFLAQQLSIPDNSQYEVFDSTITEGGTMAFWSWKDYEHLMKQRRYRQNRERIHAIISELEQMAERGEPLGIQRSADVARELESLSAEEEELRCWSVALLNAQTIEEYSSLFTNVKDIAFRKIDSITEDTDLSRKLRRVKENWEAYSIYVEDAGKSSGGHTSTLLGLSSKGIIIHSDLWARIVTQEDAGEILAEIITRAILKDIESEESDDNFRLAGIFTNQRLRQLEEEVLKKTTLKGKTPTFDLLRVFNGLSPVQKQILKMISHGDPSALFSPVSDFTWLDWDLLFSYFDDIVLIDGEYQYAGICRVFTEAESNIHSRISDAAKQGVYTNAIHDLQQRLKILADFIVENFEKFKANSFSNYHWKCLARLDMRIRDKIVMSEDASYAPVVQDIAIGILNKLRQAGIVENPNEIMSLSANHKVGALGLQNLISAYSHLTNEPFFVAELYAGDFFETAKRANIKLRYPNVQTASQMFTAETAVRLRSEAMKYLMNGIKSLPKALMWKLPKPIEIEVKFEPIPEELRSEIEPQLAAACYKFEHRLLEKIQLTMIGYPTGEQLQGVVTTLIHEILHKLDSEILPIKDFHDLCGVNGFNEYFEIGTIHGTGISRKPITDIVDTEERKRLGYLNFAYQRADGSLVSYLMHTTIEKYADVIAMLREEGVEIIEDNRERHILSSPDEVIATVGSEDEISFLRRHGNLVSIEKRNQSLQILQRHLLRSAHPVAETRDGTKIYELYLPSGEAGFVTRFVDERGNILHNLPSVESFVNSGDSRSHRFPRVINARDFYEVFTQKLLAGGITFSEVNRILREGLKRRALDGSIIEESHEIKEMARSALSEILARDIPMSTFDMVIDFHEQLHAIISREDAEAIRAGIISEVGEDNYNLLKVYFQNLYGEYQDELELLEELIVTMFTEECLGNPVRLLINRDRPETRADLTQTIWVSEFTIRNAIKRYKCKEIELISDILKKGLTEGRNLLKDTTPSYDVQKYRIWKRWQAEVQKIIDTLNADELEIFINKVSQWNYPPKGFNAKRIGTAFNELCDRYPALNLRDSRMIDWINGFGNGGGEFVRDAIKMKGKTEIQTGRKDGMVARALALIRSGETDLRKVMAELATNGDVPRGISIDSSSFREDPLAIAVSQCMYELIDFYKLSSSDPDKLISAEVSWGMGEGSLSILSGFDLEKMRRKGLALKDPSWKNTNIDIKVVFHQDNLEVVLVYRFPQMASTVHIGSIGFAKPLAELKQGDNMNTIVSEIADILRKGIRDIHKLFQEPLHTQFPLPLYERFIATLRKLAVSNKVIGEETLLKSQYWQKRGVNRKEAYILSDMYYTAYNKGWPLYFLKFKQEYDGWRTNSNFHFVYMLFMDDWFKQLVRHFEKFEQLGSGNTGESLWDSAARDPEKMIKMPFDMFFHPLLTMIPEFFSKETFVEAWFRDILAKLLRLDNGSLQGIVSRFPASIEEIIAEIRKGYVHTGAGQTPEDILKKELYNFKAGFEKLGPNDLFDNLLNLLMNNIMHAHYIAGAYGYRFTNPVNVLRFIYGLNTGDSSVVRGDIYIHLLDSFAQKIPGMAEDYVHGDLKRAKDILGMSDEDSLDEQTIKTMYRRAAFAVHPDHASHRIAEEARKRGLEGDNAKSFIETEMRKAAERFREIFSAYEVLLDKVKSKSHSAGSDSTWIYTVSAETAINTLQRQYLEESAHDYLVSAGKEGRIIRIQGPGVNQANIASLVENYCRINKVGNREQILTDLERILEYINSLNIAELNNTAIAVVVSGKEETEPIGFSHIGIASGPEFMAITAVGGRYAYEGAGVKPYTIYLRLDDILAYIRQGEEGKRAFAEKLKHEWHDAERKLCGETVRHVDESDEIIRLINAIEARIIPADYEARIKTVHDKANRMGWPEEYRFIAKKIIETGLTTEDVPLEKSMQLARKLFSDSIKPFITRATISALGVFLTREGLTDDNYKEIGNLFFVISRQRGDLQPYIVELLKTIMNSAWQNPSVYYAAGRGLYLIAMENPDIRIGIKNFFINFLKDPHSNIQACIQICNVLTSDVYNMLSMAAGRFLPVPEIFGFDIDTVDAFGIVLSREDIDIQGLMNLCGMLKVIAFGRKDLQLESHIKETLMRINRSVKSLVISGIISELNGIRITYPQGVHQEYMNIPNDMRSEHGLLEGMDEDGFYLGDTEESRITEPDIQDTSILDIGDNRHFVVSNKILETIPVESLKSLLLNAMGCEDLRNLAFGDGPIVITTCRRSARLFGDCVSNRLIIINEAFLKLYREIGDTSQAQGLLQLGLEHELLHELRGQGREIEGELYERDIKRMTAILGDKARETIKYLSLRCVLSKGFYQGFINSIAQKISEKSDQDLILHLDQDGAVQIMGLKDNTLILSIDSEYWDIFSIGLDGRKDTTVEFIPKGASLKYIKDLLHQTLFRRELISKDNALTKDNLDGLEVLTRGIGQKKNITISSKFLVDSVTKKADGRFEYSQNSSGIKFLVSRIKQGFSLEIINEAGITDDELQRLLSAVFNIEKEDFSIVDISTAQSEERYRDGILLLHEESSSGLLNLQNVNKIIGEKGISINILVTVGIYKLLNEPEMERILQNLGYTPEQSKKIISEGIIRLPPVISLAVLINEIASIKRIIDTAA